MTNFSSFVMPAPLGTPVCVPSTARTFVYFRILRLPAAPKLPIIQNEKFGTSRFIAAQGQAAACLYFQGLQGIETCCS
jgi:hypothetical protein